MNKILALIMFSFFSLSSYNAFSYQVIKVNNKKLLLSFSYDETVEKRDTFYVINNDGKKKAIVSIIKVKGNKAIAKVLKGKARAGWSLRLRKRAVKRRAKVKASYAAKTVPVTSNYSPRKSKKLFNNLNFLWGYSINSLTIGNLTHSDSSLFNFETSTTLFLPNKPMFGLRIFSGTENFKIKATCSNNTNNTNVDCETSIVYMSGGVLAVAQIPVSNKLSVWGGLGLKLVIPLSKTVTSPADVEDYIDEESIKLTSSLLLSGGLTFNLSPRFSIPININYTILPSSETIENRSIFNIQTGLVYHF